jgi:hypothetical protein
MLPGTIRASSDPFLGTPKVILGAFLLLETTMLFPGTAMPFARFKTNFGYLLPLPTDLSEACRSSAIAEACRTVWFQWRNSRLYSR